MIIHPIQAYAVEYDTFAGDVYTLDTASITLTAGSMTAAGGGFTGVASGVLPVASSDLAIKEYVDSAITFVAEYFFNDTASDIGGIYYKMLDTPTGEAESSFTTAGLGTGDDQALSNFATDAGIPGLITLEKGVYDGHIHAEKTAGTKPVKIHFEIYSRATDTTETLIATSEESGFITSKEEVSIHATLAADVTIATTDRIIVKWLANVDAAGSAATVVLYAEGTNSSRLAVPISSNILNQLYVRQDGTKPLTANWVVGGFDFSSVGNIFVSDGKGIVIGHTSKITDGVIPELQVLGTGGADSCMFLGRWGNNTNPPNLKFVKSRNATIGSNTIVQDNDELGGIKWYPDDGVDFATVAADICVEVDDASPAAGDIGTAFVWMNMPGGGGAIRETMRLSAAGVLSVIGTITSGKHTIQTTAEAYSLVIEDTTNARIVLDRTASGTEGAMVLDAGSAFQSILFDSNGSGVFRIRANDRATLIGGTPGSGATTVWTIDASGNVTGVGTLTGHTTATFGNININVTANSIGGSSGLALLGGSGQQLYAAPASITTTASAANQWIDSSSPYQMKRSTSSARYKTIIGDMTEEEAAVILNLRPRKYFSKVDDPDKHFFGLVAEEVEVVFPEATTWGIEYTKDGEVVYKNGEDVVAADVINGYDINFIVAGLIKQVQVQHAEIQALK